MSWQHLWFRRLLRRWRTVSGYILAFATAVALFYFFQAVSRTFQAEISGYLAGFLVAVLRVFQGIVLLSAFWIVAFFHQLVLERERPALGLFWTLGLSLKDRLVLVVAESVFLGVWGLFIGLLAGVVLEPAFLLALTVVLDLPTRLPYRMDVDALLRTIGLFLALALLEGAVNGIRLVRRWPRLLFVRREPRHPGRPSLAASIAGIVLTGFAYCLAVTVHPDLFEQQARAFAEGRSGLGSQLLWLLLVPILLMLTLVGSWLILKESLRGAVGIARRMPVVSARLLVSASEIAWRVREHAFGTAALSGLLALAALGGTALVTAQIQFLRSAVEDQPSIVEVRASDPSSVDAARATARRLAAFLETGGFRPVERLEIELFTGLLQPIGAGEPATEQSASQLPPAAVPVIVVERDAYDSLRSAIVRCHPELETLLPRVPLLERGQAFLVLQGVGPSDLRSVSDVPWLGTHEPVEFVALPGHALFPGTAADDRVRALQRAPRQPVVVSGYGAYRGRIVSRGFGVVPSSLVLVVDPATFAALQADRETVSAVGAGPLTLVSLFYPDWQKSARVLDRWLQTPGQLEGDVTVSALPILYRQEKQTSAALLFLLAAVAVLFLVAYAASMSFRVLEAFWDDVRRARLLYRLGAPPGMIRSLLRWEIASLFVAPIGLAVLHSWFAVVDWGRTMAVGTVLRFHPLWTPLAVWASVFVIALCIAGCWIAILGTSTVREVTRRAVSERAPE
jgi:hypothetical protein